MKRFVSAAMILLATQLCLAQSDSAAPAADTTKTRVQIDQTTGDSTMVTVTTEKGAADSTTTVVIRHHERGNRGRDQRMRPRRDWVLGCRMANLEFKSFPGTVFLQRRAGRFSFFGIGFCYTNEQIKPSEYHARNDSTFLKTTCTDWTLTVNPELALFLERGALVSTLAAGGIYEYGRCRFNSEVTSTYSTFTSSGLQSRCITTQKYGMELSVSIERRFVIGRSVFSAGLRSLLISAITSSRSEEENNITNYTSGGTTETTNNRTRSFEKKPVRFIISSPFNGSASIHLKYWF